VRGRGDRGVQGIAGAQGQKARHAEAPAHAPCEPAWHLARGFQRVPTHPPTYTSPARPPDLVPREIGEQWLKFYRQELPTVAFKASTQQQASGLGGRGAGGKGRSAAGGEGGSGCLGADTLLQLLKNYARNKWAGRGQGRGVGSCSGLGGVKLPRTAVWRLLAAAPPWAHLRSAGSRRAPHPLPPPPPRPRPRRRPPGA
jgi:hypothetical protein